MSDLDQLLSQIPLAQIAAQLGADPSEVEQAAQTALPALLGGLQANAQDPAAAASLAEALGQHDGSLLGADADAIDPADGQAIVGHIFGANQDAVMSQLGGVSPGGQSLIGKLLPYLAPLVMAYLSKRLQGAGGAGGGGLGDVLGGGAGGGGLGDVLGGVLGGGQPGGGPLGQGAPAPGQGGGLGDILGQILGGAGGGLGGSGGGVDVPQQQAPQTGGLDAGSIITNVLGGLLGGGRR